MGEVDNLHIVVLCGGEGSRLWPVSTPNYPKQFLSLGTTNTLFQETLLRAKSLSNNPPIVVCNKEHKFIAAEQARLIGVELEVIITENIPKNTAPAANLASSYLSDDALVLLMPSDHVISGFEKVLQEGVREALKNKIVTFGIKPTSPETGYGYIKHEKTKIEKFIEKPSLKKAQELLNSGNCLWNSGIFLFKNSVFKEELKSLCPDVFINCSIAMVLGKKEGEFFYPEEKSFNASPSISIDYAVMEKTKLGSVIESDISWSDVGSWDKVWEKSEKDENGNVTIGAKGLVDTNDSYIRSDGPEISAIGLKNMMIIASKNNILVAPMSRNQEIKKLVNER